MLQLQMFGGLSLVDAAGQGLEVEARGLALLVLVAVSGDRGLRRGELEAYLSVGSESGGAGLSIDLLLDTIRQFVPQDPFHDGDPLRTNSAAITSDVPAFRAAVVARAFEEALALYRGPFLDGFHLAELPAFERWSEGQRTMLSSEHTRVLYRLARLAGERGQRDLAINSWVRLTAIDPLDERSALGLARALVLAGDWSGAIGHATAFDARVPPGTEDAGTLVAFVERLRLDLAHPGGMA